MTPSLRSALFVSAAFSAALGLSAFALPQLDPQDPLADLADTPQAETRTNDAMEFEEPVPEIDPETGLPMTEPGLNEFSQEDEIQFPRIAPIFAPDYDPEDYIIRPPSEDEDAEEVDPFAPVDEQSDAPASEEDDVDDAADTEEDEASEAELQNLEYVERPAVMLRGLDKISGRSTDLEVGVDSDVLFGGLRVTVKACHQTPPTEAPESVAYIEVEDYGFALQDTPELPQEIDLERRVFNGWMFASSPGLNGLEHPIYDVWVIRCMAEAPVRSDEGSAL
ncbi:MAG: hypothetical protein CMK09_00135 [Ponticaulis sp.]|nr:hypothetical protein [Ponticaulis sp.]|tara:strand:- start:30367 stop:31203 length:837 start_codon:yes stop_codon:yes gene_type:complete